MKKPVILHICLSQGWGGLEMYPIRTGKEFLDRGYKVYGLCTAGTQVADGMREAGLETFEVSSKGQLLASQLLKLNKWLKRRNVEIVHCHKSGDILVSALMGLLTRRKTFFTEHMGVTRPKKDFYHKWVYSHVQQVFSISNETYKRNINALPVPKEKIKKLWLGTDIPFSTHTSYKAIELFKNELGLPIDSTIVSTVGRISPGKGQLELLKAFETIAPTFENLNLLIVGGLAPQDGADADYVSELKKIVNCSQFEDRIHLAGFQRDVSKIYALSDIVCLPYLNEAFGLTAIEAMSNESAIVAANTGALPEILGQNAIYCDPTSSKDIANAIIHYLENSSLLKQNAKESRKRAIELFSTEKHIELLSEFYDEATKN